MCCDFKLVTGRKITKQCRPHARETRRTKQLRDIHMNLQRLRASDSTQRRKPLERTTRETRRTRILCTRLLVHRTVAHELNCNASTKTMDIAVAQDKVTSYVARLIPT